MPPQPPPKGPKRPAAKPAAVPPPKARTKARPAAPPPSPSPKARLKRGPVAAAPLPLPLPPGVGPADVSLGVAVEPGEGGTVTARRAGGLRDIALDVDPGRAGLAAALQHMAKAVNVAFQSDYGENDLEAVYQAAIVRNGEIRIVHREYFGFGETWFGQFGRLLKSLRLTFEGPDPASPEGARRYAEKGPATIRGLLNLAARKLDLVAEYEDKVPAYVEQMFDRLEASGIIVGWDRGDWEISTTPVGLDIRIAPRSEPTPRVHEGVTVQDLNPNLPPAFGP